MIRKGQMNQKQDLNETGLETQQICVKWRNKQEENEHVNDFIVYVFTADYQAWKVSDLCFQGKFFLPPSPPCTMYILH